jgi:hypothetical protein
MASPVFDKSERADLREEDDRGGPGFALEEVHWPSGGMNHHPVSDGEASVTVPSGSGRLTMYGRGSATRTPRGGGKWTSGRRAGANGNEAEAVTSRGNAIAAGSGSCR